MGWFCTLHFPFLYTAFFCLSYLYSFVKFCFFISASFIFLMIFLYISLSIFNMYFMLSLQGKQRYIKTGYDNNPYPFQAILLFYQKVLLRDLKIHHLSLYACIARETHKTVMYKDVHPHTVCDAQKLEVIWISITG